MAYRGRNTTMAIGDLTARLTCDATSFIQAHVDARLRIEAVRTHARVADSLNCHGLDGSACVEEWDPDFDPRSILIKDL